MIISSKKNIKNILFVFVFYIVSFFAPDSAFSQFQIKIATLAPQNSEWAQKFLEGSTEIQKKTDNRVKLKFYWGGAQGNAKKNLQKIKIDPCKSKVLTLKFQMQKKKSKNIFHFRKGRINQTLLFG